MAPPDNDKFSHCSTGWPKKVSHC